MDPFAIVRAVSRVSPFSSVVIIVVSVVASFVTHVPIIG